MRVTFRVLLVVVAVAAFVITPHPALAKVSVTAVYFPHIEDCNDGGGWFVTATDDDGVSTTYLYCDGGYIP